MFVFSLILSVVLLVVVARYAFRTPPPVGKVAGVCSAAAIGPFCLTMLLAPFQASAAVMAVTAGLLLAPRNGRRAYLGLSLAVTVVAYLIALWAAVEQRREYEVLRGQYGFEPLADRLPPRPAGTMGTTPVDESRIKLIEDEVWVGGSGRSYTLRRLHDERVLDFIDTPGFGVMRAIPRPSAAWLKTQVVGPVPKPVHTGPDRSAGVTLPAWSATDFDGLHRSGVLDFVHPAGFGLVRDGRVTGFESHRFSKVPGPERGWAVTDLDLIGLVVHPTPVAYVSKNLPRMDELKAAPTRPLDPFEADALGRLRGSEDIVVKPSAGGLRMVGAVRAVKQCVECHGGTRGDLLGAFSYHLRPAE
ncbi:MAG: hypothetical protein U0871_12685 [Gemmataceae bacterium]